MRNIVTWLVAVSASVAVGAEPTASEATVPLPRQSVVPLANNGGPLARQAKFNSNIEGWALTGAQPERYEVKCDAIFSNCAIPILRSRGGADGAMGSVTHSEPADTWRGRRVELRVNLKAGNVAGWAGAWMRVDDADGNPLTFDNMSNRPLKGTSAFDWYSVVLDVPADADRITFGVMLNGQGAVFIRELDVSAVDKAKVASTNLLPDRPLHAAVTVPQVGQ